MAASLSGQGKYAKALEIEREVLVSTTRLLGAEHEQSLGLANTLALSLWRCGLKTEAEQLLCETLALSRRAFGPNHKFTQHVIQCLRVRGLTAR